MSIYSVTNLFYAFFQIKIQIFTFITVKVNILLTLEDTGVIPKYDNGEQLTI